MDELTVVATPAGFRSVEAARFVWQLDDLSRRLTEDTRTLTGEDLAWQPRPGTNTMGMLLAHIAIVEVFWSQIGLEEVPFDTRGPLGIGPEDDGMPVPPTGGPPATLAGRDLAWFDDLLARGRAHLVRAVRTLDDAALGARVTRRRVSGAEHTFDKAWVLYHLVEHLAGHYGQILLLAHLRRDAR